MNEFTPKQLVFLQTMDQQTKDIEEKKISVLYLGCLLFVFGCIGFIWMLLNPFHIFGAFVYLGIGSYLIMHFGKDFLREYLPRSVYSVIFEKSCLELILHSNTFYQILGVVLISKSGIKQEIKEFLLKNQLSSVSTELPAKNLIPKYLKPLIVDQYNSHTLPISPASPSISPALAIPLLPSPTSITHPLTPIAEKSKSTSLSFPMDTTISSSLQLFPSSPTALLKFDPMNFFLQESFKQSSLSTSTSTSNTRELEKNIINFYNLFLFCIWNFLESKMKDYQQDFLISLQRYSSPDYLFTLPWMKSITEAFHSSIDHLLSLRLDALPFYPQDSCLAERLSLTVLQHHRTRTQVIPPVFQLVAASSSYLVAIKKMKMKIESSRRCSDEQMTMMINKVKTEREVVIYLSYLLLMLLAYRWQILPRKISWLQRIVLARLLKDLSISSLADRSKKSNHS